MDSLRAQECIKARIVATAAKISETLSHVFRAGVICFLYFLVNPEWKTLRKLSKDNKNKCDFETRISHGELTAAGCCREIK